MANAFSACFRLFRRPSSRRAGRQAQTKPKGPTFELLEDRLSPATLTVNSVADAVTADGNLTLREAIAIVNAGNTTGRSTAEIALVSTSGGALGTNDTIQFAASVTQSGPATITLAGTRLTVSKSVAIVGPGANLLAVSANNASRNFSISSGITAAIQGITVQKGVELQGGAFYVAGTLNLSQCVLQDNVAQATNVQGGLGGAIMTSTGATLNVDRCLFVNNKALGENGQNGSATGGGGGGGGGAGVGGALFVEGTTTLTNSTFTSNLAKGGDGGAGFANGGALNGSGGRGGGGLAFGGAPGLAGGSGAAFAGGGGGGGSSTVGGAGGAGGTFGGGGGGGARTGGGNGGAGGGGPFGGGSGGQAIASGAAGGGGGAGIGGAVYTVLGIFTAINCTFANNTAQKGLGGVGAFGGIDRGEDGLGISGSIFPQDTVILKNTIVAANTADQGPDISFDVDPSSSNNIIGNGSALTGITNGLQGNQIGTAANPINPLLGPLANNGGPIKTMALLAGSPAIDAGSGANFPQYRIRADNIPAGSASAIIQNGKLQIQNRAHVSTPSFDPAAGGLHITATWTADSSDSDFLQILTRSDGVPNAGSFGETSNGIEFQADASANVIKIVGRGGASVTGGAVVNFPGGIKPGATYNIDITDDGTNLTFKLTDAANAANTSTTTGTSSFHPATNRVTLHNRELGGGGAANHTALIDNLTIKNTTNAVLLTDDFSLPNADQRGVPRFFGAPDIGAFETVPSPLVVDTATDIVDGDYSAGNLSLREALAIANADGGANTITFAPGLDPINLTAGELLLTDVGLTAINGPTGGTQIIQRSSAANTPAFSVFDVASGANAAFNFLTITNGLTAPGGDGGGIANSGILTVTDCTIQGNADHMNDDGGIINHTNANLSLVRSTIANNTGAGLDNNGIASLVNSTISGNQAINDGGGISNLGTITIANSTIVGNRTDADGNGVGVGGGIRRAAGSVSLYNSLVAGNFFGGGTNRDDIFGTIAAASANNLIGDGTGLTGITNGSQGNKIGTLASPINPLLGSLASNGGPTQTYALLAGSPAIDSGSGVYFPLYNVRTDNIPAGGASVTVQGGALQIQNRGYLNTAGQFDPGAGGIHITATWTADASDSDFLQILTRSDGVPNAGNFGETTTGVEFQADASGNVLKIVARGAATVSGATAVAFPGGIKPNTTYTIDIADNGGNLIFTLTDASNPGNTASVTGATSFQAATNFVTIHDREFGGGIANANHTALIDNLTIQTTANAVLLADDFPTLRTNTDQRGSLRFVRALDIGAFETTQTPTTTQLAVSSAASTNAGVLLTVNVSPSPGNVGNVAFFEDGLQLDSGPPVNGQITRNISGVGVGNHVFTAVYSGGAGFDGSSSAAKTVTVFASPLVVDSSADIDDGNYAANNLTLREAIKLANAAPGADTITFANSLTGSSIVLGGSRLEVNDSLTITGLGADKLTIDGNNASQLFYIDGRTNGSINVTIEKITLTKGKATSGGKIIDFNDSASFGGALLNDKANVTLRDFVVSNSSTAINGGGLYNWQNGSIMTLVNGAVVNNSASLSGGGIFNWQNNQLSLTNVTVSGNSSIAGGAGIYNFSGAVLLSNCSLTANRVDLNANSSGTGGGFNGYGGTSTFNNTLIAGNFNAAGATASDLATVEGATIASASANNLIGVDTGFTGITNGSQGNKIGTAANPINPLLVPLANNGGPTPTHALQPGSPAIDAGSNALIPAGITTDQRGAGFPRVLNNTVDIGAFESTPIATTTQLTVSSLAARTGTAVTLTATVSPSPGAAGRVTFFNNGLVLASNLPVVNGQASVSLSSSAPAGSYVITATYNGVAGYLNSTSAATTVTVFASPLVVDTASDVDDGNYSAGNLSLREAIKLANAAPGIDTITFADSLTGGSIVLGGSRLNVTDSVNITGLGADKLSIDGNNASQLFYIDGRTNGSINVTIEKITLTKGTATSGGKIIDTYDSASYGGILLNDQANLTLRNFVASNGSSSLTGGGLYNWKNGSVMTLINGAILNNSSTFGGGIYCWSNSQLSAINVTFSGNVANTDGAAIDSQSATVLLSDCTISGNRADADGNGSGVGGGIGQIGSLTLNNCLVAGNFHGTGTSPDDLAASGATAGSNNLIGVGFNVTGIANGSQGNMIGTAANPINPLLGALANNGGPTPTYALQPGSPAIDAGSNALIPAGVTTDQRSAGFGRVLNSIVDIGAFEAAAPTTTTLIATPLATTGGSAVMFTATVSPTPDAGTVTFTDNGVTLADNVSLLNGHAVFSTSTLSTGSHPVIAAYSGTSSFAPSASAAQNVSVFDAIQIAGYTINAGLPPAFLGQHSRIGSYSVTFNQAVQLDAGALSLGLHTNGVSYNNVPMPNGMGAVPTLITNASADKKTWTIFFMSANGLGADINVGGDGIASLLDGVYDFTVNAAKVHPFGAPGLQMAANTTTTFHRFFGDTSAPDTTVAGGSTAFTALDNSVDNLDFLTAFNKPVGGGYQPYLDFNGDGVINSLDNIEVRTRFNKALTWRA